MIKPQFAAWDRCYQLSVMIPQGERKRPLTLRLIISKYQSITSCAVNALFTAHFIPCNPEHRRFPSPFSHLAQIVYDCANWCCCWNVSNYTLYHSSETILKLRGNIARKMSDIDGERNREKQEWKQKCCTCISRVLNERSAIFFFISS